MQVARVLIAGSLSVLAIGAATPATNAPATNPPAITSFACNVGDVWTFRYAGKSATDNGLNGSETWTRTACGDHAVLHPNGQLIKADVVADPEGNYSSGFSPFTGTAQKYNKPYPWGHLPLAPGASWDSAVDVDMGGGRGYTGTGHWKAIGWEAVTVPAGTYTCLRKEVKIDLEYAFMYSGVTSSQMRTMSGTYQETTWYSPDARIDVKSTSSDTFGDTASRELTALTLKS
jgi:hypothetical protein